MKIGIYGDSFFDKREGWPRELEKILKAEIDIYAEGGTSIDYSYLNFIKTHEQYDKIIFGWTNPGRTALVVSTGLNDFVHIGEYHQHHSRKYNAEFNNLRYEKGPCQGSLLNTDFVWQIDNFKGNMDKYYKWEEYMATQSYPGYHNLLKQKAMKDSVKLLRPDAININCFSEVYNEENVKGMFEIWLADFYSVYGENKYHPDYTDDLNKRINHMTPQQNKEFGRHLIRHMKDRKFDIHKTFLNPEKYYTISTNKAEAGIIKHKFK